MSDRRNMQNTLRVMDFFNPDWSDSEIIEACLAFAEQLNQRCIVFDGKDWLIDRAILLPSYTTVIIDGVTIRQNEKVFDNIFRGANLELDKDDPYGYPTQIHPLKSIRILGKNGARLEGPTENLILHHPTHGNMQPVIGDYWGWRGFIISLTACQDFEISGFFFLRQRSWAISMDWCTQGYLHDLEFVSTVKNGDGINVRLGCRDIAIERIKGDTSDDLIAINNVAYENIQPEGNYVFPLYPSYRKLREMGDERLCDISNISVCDVHSYTPLYSHGVALLARMGYRISNISICNVFDANPVCESNRLAIVGSYKGYGNGSDGDISMVRINNIVSNSAKAAIVFNDPVSDVWINNVQQNRADGVILRAVDEEGIRLTNC